MFLLYLRIRLFGGFFFTLKTLTQSEYLAVGFNVEIITIFKFGRLDAIKLLSLVNYNRQSVYAS